MAKIPLPERGQPFDVTYVYQLANAINDLASQVSPSTSKYVTVDTVTSGQQNIKASEAKIIGGYVEVANNSTVSSGNEKAFSYSFQTDFKYAPIVTATPINIGNTTAGKDITIVLKSITTSGIEGIVKYNASGNLSVAVNIIAVGIPN